MQQRIKQIAVGLSGASGAPYFMRLLERLRERKDVAVHVFATEGGKRVLQTEAGMSWNQLDLSGCEIYPNKDIGARLASGSFRLDGLAVVPCSMNSLCAMAAGVANNLLLRAAAVQLKENRKLVLVPRETPLSLIGLRAMVTLKESGAIILPASPGFYHQPENIEDLLDTVVDRILDQLGLEDEDIKRWNP